MYIINTSYKHVRWHEFYNGSSEKRLKGIQHLRPQTGNSMSNTAAAKTGRNGSIDVSAAGKQFSVRS